MRTREAAAVTAGLMGVEAALVLGSTITDLHRRRSHGALELPEPLSKGAYLVTQPFTDGANWSFIHQGLHHSLTDSNFGSFVEIADRIDYGPSSFYCDVPERFDNLDSAAKGLSLDRVLEIGRAARHLVEGWYEPYADATPERDAIIFDTVTPRYLYTNFGPQGDERVEPDGPYRIEDLMWRLRDPHAPNLHPRGVKGIFFGGNNAYHVPERSPLFNEMMPQELRRNEWEERVYKYHEPLMKVFILGNIALGAMGGGALSRESRLKGLIKGTLAGGAMAIGTAGVLLKASELTNAMGHAGADAWGAVLKNNLIPYPNGSYATDANKVLSYVSMDEAGTQGEHHRSPHLNAYTKETGLKGMAAAPVGKVIDFMAERNIVFKRGKGFPDQSPRPDEAHKAVLMLQQDRIETYEQSPPAYNLTYMLSEAAKAGDMRRCAQLLRMTPEELAKAA